MTNDSFIITTSPFIEGYEIVKYLGIVSGEASIGTGIFAEFHAGVADFFGTDSGAYSSKIGKSKALALGAMRNNAKKIGANAVIAVDIDIMSTDANMFITCANGTAVEIKKRDSEAKENAEEFSERSVVVTNYCEYLPIRFGIAHLRISSDSGMFQLSFDGKIFSDVNIDAIRVDVKYVTIFNEEIDGTNYSFALKMKSGAMFTTSPYEVNLDKNEIPLIKAIKVFVKTYVSDGTAIDVSNLTYTNVFTDAVTLETKGRHGIDYIGPFEKSETGWRCICGKHNPLNADKCEACNRTLDSFKQHEYVSMKDIFTSVRSLESAQEIYNAVSDFSQKNPDIKISGLLSELQKDADAERTTEVNRKQSAIKLMQMYESRIKDSV